MHLLTWYAYRAHVLYRADGPQNPGPENINILTIAVAYQLAETGETRRTKYPLCLHIVG